MPCPHSQNPRWLSCTTGCPFLRNSSHMTANVMASLRGSLCRGELGCGGGNERGLIAQNAGDYNDSFIRLFPLLLLDGFAHGGHGFHRVAGVEARRVELMLKPRPIRQARG